MFGEECGPPGARRSSGNRMARPVFFGGVDEIRAAVHDLGMLTDDEKAVARGDRGDAAAMAMRIVAEAARLMGAPRLIPIASAHIDGALYHGDSGTLFAEKLVQGGAKVAVRSTLNVGALDLVGCSRQKLPPHERDMAKRMMRAYEAMGCEPSWTCAPYQAGHRPATGTDVAWGESNAVVFCNSVLGARTNRYGDFLDIACAIAGRAPDYGLHRPDQRRATLLIDLTAIAPELKKAEAFYPVLGTWLGLNAGPDIAVIDGLQGIPNEDHLKALGAASASAGGVGLFHVAGVTPEAPDAATALGHQTPRRILKPSAMDLAKAHDRLSTVATETIDAVAIGSPHLSLDEVDALETYLAGRRVGVPFYACTGRHVIRALDETGRRTQLESQGIIFVADTCVVVTPMLPQSSGVLMTNSGKFAHYAPGNTGYGVAYGALKDCVESAISGRLTRDERLWR
jgi:predicted aconitase